MCLKQLSMLAFLSKVHKGGTLSYQSHCWLLRDWTYRASHLHSSEPYLTPFSQFGCATAAKVSARKLDVSGMVTQLLLLMSQCFTVPVAPAPGAGTTISFFHTARQMASDMAISFCWPRGHYNIFLHHCQFADMGPNHWKKHTNSAH